MYYTVSRPGYPTRNLPFRGGKLRRKARLQNRKWARIALLRKRNSASKNLAANLIGRFFRRFRR